VSESYREQDSKQLRVLFCIGVMPAFFEQESARIGPTVEAITRLASASERSESGSALLARMTSTDPAPAV